MKLPTYQFVAQIGAAFAVIASLGLVAYELKQSRDLAIGELALSVYEAETNLYLTILDAEAYNRGVYKLENNGGELTWDERKNFWRVRMANQGITIAKFELWKLGLLSDAEWEWSVQKMKESWITDPMQREIMLEGSFQNPEFIEFLNRLTADWEAERDTTPE